MTDKRLRAMALLGLVAVFAATMSKAYTGWFSGDDLDNVFWTRAVSMGTFLGGLLTPVFNPDNFRPVGHFFFHVMGGVAGVNFPWYMLAIHALHFLNLWLIFRLLRRMEVSPAAACWGAAFFVLPMAAFDALWKSMYVFDVLGATLCLACLLAYSARRFILAFVFFWLAYKTKEFAVMMPLLLALWEWTRGQRKWKHLAPFFAVSALFGLQALAHPGEPGADYTMQFTFAALAKTVGYYSSRMFFLPWLGVATLALPLLFRRSGVLLGVAGFWLLMAPMLFLPMRVYPAYLYAPLAMLALAIGAMASDWRWEALVVLAAAWWSVNFYQMRPQRTAWIATARSNHAYYNAAARHFRAHPAPTAVVFESLPVDLSGWGAKAAAALASNTRRLETAEVGQPAAAQLLQRPGVAVFAWDDSQRVLLVSSREANDAPPAGFRFKDAVPYWHLGEGWNHREYFYRWIRPRAAAMMTRPSQAGVFRLQANVAKDIVERFKQSNVELFLDGKSYGTRAYGEIGVHSQDWNVASAPAGPVKVELRVSPSLEAPGGGLGIAVAECGFVER